MPKTSTPPIDRPSASESVGQAATHGVAWMMALSIGQRLIGVASQILLARLLVPEDFGLIGLALSVTAVIGALTGFGLDEVLVQRHRTVQAWSGSAFALALGVSALGSLLILVAAPIAARAYQAPELLPMLAILALAPPAGALSTVSAAVLRIRMRFRLLAALAGGEVLFVSLATVALAWAGLGAFSFVVPMPLAGLLRGLVYWRFAPVRLSRVRLRQVRSLVARGLSVLGQRLVTTLIPQSQFVVLGLLTSPTIVGLYYFAQRLAIQPLNLLAGNISTILFPVLSGFRSDAAKQRQILLRLMEGLNYVVMPACFLLAALAEYIVEPVFGAKWRPAIPLLALLSVGVALDAAAWQVGAYLNARGQFRRTFLYTLAIAPIFLVLLGLGALTGTAVGVAVGVAAYYILCSPLFSYLALRTDDVSLWEVIKLYARPALLSGACIGLSALVAHAPIWGDSALLRAAVICGLAAVTYLPLLRLAAPEVYGELKARVFGLLASRPAAASPGSAP